MKAVFGWLGRTGVLYLVLCLAFAFYILAWPQIRNEFSSESLQQDAMSAADIREAIGRERAELEAGLEQREAAIRAMGKEQLDSRLTEARAERETLLHEMDEGGGLLDALRPSRLLAAQQAKLQLAALDAEIAALETAREAEMSRIAVAAAQRGMERYRRIPTENAIRVSFRLCREAEAAVEDFAELNAYEREARELFLRERERLENTRDERCEAARERQLRRTAGLAARERLGEARRTYERASDWSMTALPDTTRDLADNTLRDVLVAAAWALLGILLLPYLLRTFLYYVIAPFAARRRSIRIAVPGANHVPIELPDEQSQASYSVTLGPGEELLVRQGFMQSSPAQADLRTRLMLDWKSPFTSLASGMTFLTRIRGEHTTTVISADDDPFAEVTAIALPEGAAMVLQPRALAAVVQPQDRPLRIESKWRLFSLNAWLTQQLRFLVFHGPARLVLKGGRGVRVEPVDSGRRFGQDQLAGFSAQLSYSVARNETFLPYLLGRQPLLRDRVEGGTGILVIEEAPYAGRRKGLRGGLEGLFDSMLKAVGI